MRILIVDDNKVNLSLLERLLKNNGYKVVSAENGAEALEKLRANGFGMIISDILMPVMDGFQLCREAKEMAKLKDIPFIFTRLPIQMKKIKNSLQKWERTCTFGSPLSQMSS